MHIWQRLSKETKIDLTNEDYYDWLSGGDGYDKFDKAVKSFLGNMLYEAGDATARIVSVLQVKLKLCVRPKYEKSLAEIIIKDPKKYREGFPE